MAELHTSVFPDPTSYAAIPVYDLLTAAARGYVGPDLRFIHAIVDQPERALPDLLRFAAQDHSEDPIDLEEDLLAIFRYLGAPEALPFYLDLIRREPESVSDELVEALVHLGPAAVEPLLQLYDELPEEQGGDVAFLLAALGIRDDRILHLLTERIEYDVTDAAFCLEVYGDPAGIPALEKVAEEVRNDDELHRQITDVIEDLRTPRTRELPGHFDIWSLYPEEAPPALDVLPEEDRLSMLSSASADLRAQAARSFFNANVDLSAKARKRLLETAKTDSAAEVRASSWEALSGGLNDPDVRNAIFKALENPETPLEEKSGIAVALAEESDLPAVRKTILDLYERPESRAKALEAMWRSFDRQFASYAPKHLDDPDLAIRRQAIWCVGYLDIRQEAGRLPEFFANDDLRPDALFAYALAAPVEVKRSRMKELFNKIDGLAGGFSVGEAELVELAIDERLAMHGLKPVFSIDEDDEEPRPAPKPGRNDPCPCGSGKKYKKCCGA